MNRSNIAALINAEHEKVERAKKAGAAAAMECGRLLHEAKETVAHGAWDAWVREHCTFSPRTAQLYMRVYRHVQADPAKAQRVADLSLREVSQDIATPKRPPAVRAQRELSPEQLRQLDDLLRSWYAGKPVSRIKFLEWLLDQDEISIAEFERARDAQLQLMTPNEQRAYQTARAPH